MRIRTTLFAGLAAGAVLFASSASAAPTVVITDPQGDVRGQAAFDIVSVTMETTKTSTAKTAPLKDFIVSIQLAAAPTVLPGTSYQVMGENAACGTFYAFVYFSALDGGQTSSMQFGNCGTPNAAGQDNWLLEPAVKVDGNKIVFTVSAKTMPPQVKAGSPFNQLIAYTAPTEPVVGYSVVDFAPDDAVAEAGSFDFAKSDKIYKYGS